MANETTSDELTEAEELEVQNTTAEEAEEAKEEQESDSSADIEKQLREHRRRIARKQRLFDSLGRGTKLIGSLAFVALALVIASYFNPISMGTSSSLVTTGSMVPYIQPGEIARTVEYDPRKGVAVGEVILVQPEEGNQYVHRVVEATANGTYITQGDASDRPDFTTATEKNITGVVFNVIRQPLAGFYTFFQLDGLWFKQAWEAATASDWTTVGTLLPFAPWGWATLLFIAVFFRALVPRFINIFIDRANLQSEVDTQRIKLSVSTFEEVIAAQENTISEQSVRIDAHEESITGHDESLNEIEPVVEEFKEEKAKKAAEEAAFAEAQAKAWDDFDPAQSIYDEPETETDDLDFTDVYLKQFNTDIPSAFEIEADEIPALTEDASLPFPVLRPTERASSGWSTSQDQFPRFATEEALPELLTVPSNPFDRLVSRTSSAMPAVASASLRAENDQFAALGIRSSGQSRSAASAFDFEED